MMLGNNPLNSDVFINVFYLIFAKTGPQKKSRQNVTECIAEIDATRADEVPKVFTSIHIRFLIKGINLQKKVVERAIELSAK